MKRTICAVPVVLLAMGAIAALHGKGLVAADRTSNRVVVHVRGVSDPVVRDASLVVPLHQRGPTQGELMMLDRKGQPAGECPLKHTDVSADVSGFVARVTVTQQFHNPSNTPIEAVYTFPLPSDAAVDDMDMRIGNRIVKGEIKRKEEARQVYEAAKAAGQAAALLDQERPNIFTQSVANIMPGEDVKITISYVNTLKYDEGKYEFVFPMVVGPRFVPSGGYTVPGKRGAPSPQSQTGRDVGNQAVVTDADKITPPIAPPGTRAGHDISLSVNLDAGIPLGEITSVMHDIDVARSGRNRATIALNNQATIPNKDFILRFNVAGGAIQTGLLTHANSRNDGYFTLILQPPAAPPQTQISNKEIVFVIDQTGSQMGTPIAMAKTAMKYAIQHLHPGDTFQLVGFNTSVYPCFDKAVQATPDNIAKAIAYLDPLEGAGGTDILKAADFALSMPVDPSRLRIICFMTDGYVGNDMQIIDYVKTHRGQARMFPFGIGSSINRFLIDGMAKEGRGQSDVIALNEDPTAAAEKFYRRIDSPVLLDPQVDWGGLPVQEVFPQQIPDVFSYGPIILKGRYTHAAEGDITVRGIVRGQPWQETIHVSLPPLQPNGGGIESLWAREKIDDLQSQDWIGAQTGSPIQNIKDQIIDVALEHRLMSQYTSFVAVEQRVVNVGGRQRTLDVPVELPEGVSPEGIFGSEKDKAPAGQFLAKLSATGSSTQMYYSLNANAPVAHSRQLGLSQKAGAAYGGGYGVGTGVVVTGAPIAVAPPPAPALRTRLVPEGINTVFPYQEDNSKVKGSAGGAARRTPTPAKAIAGKKGEVLYDLGDRVDQDSLSARSFALAEGKRDALKGLKPVERTALLESVKMHTALHGLGARVKAEGKNGTLHTKSVQVDNGRVWVQVWVKSTSKGDLAKLRAAGLNIETTLIPGKLVLGSVSVVKLDALAELDIVARIEPVILK